MDELEGSGLLENVPAGFEPLRFALAKAVERSAQGKGVRHQSRKGESFLDQRIMRSARQFGLGFALGQIAKKVEEVPKFRNKERKQNELLDIIVYAASAWLALEEGA